MQTTLFVLGPVVDCVFLLALISVFQQERKQIWSDALATIPEPDVNKTIWGQKVGEADADQVRPVILTSFSVAGKS
jgi:hypothetical protein